MSNIFNTPMKPGDVIVRVGANAVRIAGRGSVFVWPVVETIWPAGDSVHGPLQVKIRWQESEKDYRDSKNQNYIALYDPETQTGRKPWVIYKVSKEDREMFQKLLKAWNGTWFLRIRQQGRPDEDHYDMLVMPGGRTRKTVVLSDYPHEALATKTSAQYTEMVYQESLAFRGSRNEPIDDEVRAKLLKQSEWVTKITEFIGGPLPWKVEANPTGPDVSPAWEEITRTEHEEIVKVYLENIALAKSLRNKLAAEDTEMAEFHERIVPLLKEARIIEITYKGFYNCYHAADVFTTEDVAGYSWSATTEIPVEESLSHLNTVTAAGYEVPFPAKHPFPVTYYAIGHGKMLLSQVQMSARGLGDYVGKAQFFLTAYLLNSEGYVYELIRGQSKDGALFISVLQRSPSEGWRYPYSLAPWIVTYLVDGVNEHCSTTIGKAPHLGVFEQNLYKRLDRKYGLVHPRPQPYYTVYLRDTLINETTAGFKKRLAVAREYDHRFDRRAHEARKVYRGPLPLPAEYAEWFQKNGYHVFTTEPLDATGREICAKKKQPLKRNDEWMAYKAFWIRDTIVGPEDKPYIPSTRKPTVGMIAEEGELPKDAVAEPRYPKLPAKQKKAANDS